MTTQQQGQELNNLNFLKSVLMLFVVLGHSLCFWGGDWFTKNPSEIVIPLITLADWLNSFHIYAFALVSGYLFYDLKFEKQKYLSFTAFLKNKWKRLIVPYVFVSCVWAIPFAVAFLHYDAKTVIKYFALGLAPGQLWFLLALFFVFIFFYPMSKFFAKHGIWGAAVICLAYGFSIVGPALLPNLFQIFHAFSYLPFFWLGFMLRRNGTSFLYKIPWYLYLFCHVALFVLSKFVLQGSGFLFSLFEKGFSFLLNAEGALMAFVVLQKIANVGNLQSCKFFSLLSKHSMSIYLFHQQIIYVLIVALNGRISPYLHGGINFILSLLISLLISLLLNRFKITRFLIGEK